jgi:hypothetical protein
MDYHVLVPPPPTNAKEIRRKLYFYIKAVKHQSYHLNYLTKQMNNCMTVYKNTLLANDPSSIYVKNAELDCIETERRLVRECDHLDELEYGVYYWKRELESFKSFGA